MTQLAPIVSTFSKYGVIDFTSQADPSIIQNLLFLKQLNKIACFHQNGLITLYEADTHFPVKTFKAHNGPITASYFHRKKKQLITEYIGEIKIWDLSTMRFHLISTLNIEISIVSSIELLKKRNVLIVAGEYKCWKKPETFDTMFMVDIEKNEVISKWKDRSMITTMQKIRYIKGKYLIACGFANGFLKLFSCVRKLDCLRVFSSHNEKITKLHISRINKHPFCISESDDNMIRLWSVKGSLTGLRRWSFPSKTLIGGTYYNQKVLVLIQEYGTQVLFVNMIKGNIVKRVTVEVSSITRGITFGRQPKVVVVLGISKLTYLGIKN